MRLKMNKEAFNQFNQKIIGGYKYSKSIGTLGEKSLHKILKLYFEENEANHEVKIGNFYVDIFKNGKIIEIQTRAFNKLRNKLAFLLEKYPVTIVYPIPRNKWIYWIDEESGEIINNRKSPKQGSFYHSFYELYKIKQYLKHPNLTICLMLIDIKEYRNLNGWSENKKKGSSRYDQIPLELSDEVYLKSVDDYDIFIPNELPKEFTSKDYQKKSPLNLRQSQIALNILTYLDIVKRTGKRGNLILYQEKSKTI